MALSCFVRRAYSSIVPLLRPSAAVRRGQFLPFLRFSTGPGNSPDHDGLDGLPFDIKAGGLDDGYITLINKSPDEIIEVKVRPYYYQVPNPNFYNDHEHEPYNSCDEFKQAIKLLEDHKDEEKDEEKEKEKEKKKEFHPLYMLVKIYHGEEFSKCQIFYIFVYPYHHDEFQIRKMSLSAADESDTKVHLEEFEEYFRKKGITPSNTNCLFDYFKKKNEKVTSVS